MGGVLGLGSVSVLARAGAKVLTYFETVGPRGDEGGEGSPLPLGLYPVYEVFRHLAHHRRSRLVDLETTDDNALVVLGLADEGDVTVFVGNLRPSATEFKIEGNSLSFRYELLDVAAAQTLDAGGPRRGSRARAALDGTVQLQPHEIAGGSRLAGDNRADSPHGCGPTFSPTRGCLTGNPRRRRLSARLCMMMPGWREGWL